RQRRRVPAASAGGDVERARARAAAAAEAMTDGAVEEQRVALVQRVDRAVEIDLDGAAYYVDEDLAGRGIALLGPRARTARPLADAQPGAVGEQLADAARRVGVDVRGRRALTGAKDTRGLLARCGPQRAHRDVERAGDPFDRRHARPREPTL